MLNKIFAHPLYIKHKEFLKFVLVGGINTVLDFLIYGFLANILGIFAVVANIASTGICTCVSFVLNSKFVWKSKKSARETAPKFFIVTLFTAWVVQSVIIALIKSFWPQVWIFSDEAILNLFAKLCASATGMIVNFFGYRLIFKERKPKSEPSE